MGRKLILMDMTSAGHKNGVERCIQMLAEGLSAKKALHVTWIRFVYNLPYATHVKECSGFTIIMVQLPGDMTSFLSDRKKRNVYWQEAYREIATYLKCTDILHIHTLNLMEFALIARECIGCKIVTHIHCLPWKALYNSDMERFNQLYSAYYIQKDYHNPSAFVRHEYEWMAYTLSDIVVCVTDCARDFIHNICPGHAEIRVVPNGIKDCVLPKRKKVPHNTLKCLFVGNPQSGKGLSFVLSAMQSLLIQHPTSLTIVGAIPVDMRNNILSQYPFLDIRFTGQIGFGQLRKIYSDSDVGLIASVQEQCSYVAIEMMMSGLPIVSTDVDGLDELITDGYNGFKVPVTFHPQHGLQVDVIKMTESVIRLGKSPLLRKEMSRNARKQFQCHHSQRKMIRRMTEIYTTLIS